MLDSEKARKIRSFVREKSIRRSINLNTNTAEIASEDAPVQSSSILVQKMNRSQSIISNIISTSATTPKLPGPKISNIKALNSLDEKSEFSGDGVSSLVIVGTEDYYSVTESTNFQKSFLHSVGNSIAEENDDILPNSPTYLNVRSYSKATERNKVLVVKHQHQT